MPEKPGSFNLLTESWIPVLFLDGTIRHVGILEALMKADRIREIAASNPMDRLGVLRFLLALLYWCKGNPPTDPQGMVAKGFPSECFARLDERQDAFNLLGEGKRFFQYRSLSGGKPPGERAIFNLLHEIPNGTNHRHFLHVTEGIEGVCPACCAMGILRQPVFATSGGRGYAPGINGTPPLYAVPLGTNLAETLVNSWTPSTSTDLGVPAWDQPDQSLPPSGEVPPLLGLTWISRQLWLGDPDPEPELCLSCGRPGHLIRHTVMAPAGSPKTDGDGPGRIWRDPHVLHTEDRKGNPYPLSARDPIPASDAASGQWTRIVGAALKHRAEERLQQSFWIVGFATDKAKYLEAVEYRLDLGSGTDTTEAVAGKLLRWQQQVAGLGKRLVPKNKSSHRKHEEIRPLVDGIRPHVERTVAAEAGRLAGGDDTAWAEAADAFRPLMGAVSRSLAPGFTTSAVERRQKVSRVRPEIPKDDIPPTGGEKGGKAP